MGFRRVAAHRVVIRGEELKQCVVEIMDGKVVNYFTFKDELPLTEWLGGRIDVITDVDGRQVAFWNETMLE